MSSSRAEEALRLFAALQNKLETETRQNEVSNFSVHTSTVKPLLRVSQSPSSSYSSRGLYTTCGAKSAAGATPIRRRTSGTTVTAAVAAASSSLVTPAASIPAGSASMEELKRKLEVADGIMKRLHGKNQQLVQRLSAMERERSTVNTAAASAEVVHLREKLRLREEEINQLKKRLEGVEETVKRDSYSSMPLPHLVRRVQQLEAQYEELLDIKINAVLKESSVEKINAEVKKLFAHMKNKMMNDACQHEAEVRRLNESLVEAERRLVALQKNSKTNV
ncbi:hypothetical protein LSM04_004349 [Trypanosoma melophagium]|uniref:uncharacterized protein n=1 Tax=Trypanosoma melophagium TaxID=715481 RepID=UPI00351A83F4|nr:hypothetical protein LSM04_004349 [Trypanosoma melophagium]